MSKESDKSTPVPTPHTKEHRKNQSTETKRTGPRLNIWAIIIIVLIALVLIGFYAGMI